MILHIDALYLLLLGESSLIVLIVAVYFLFRSRKYRKLYLKAQKDLEDARKAQGATPPPAPQVQADPVQEGAGDAAEAMVQEAPPVEQSPEQPAEAGTAIEMPPAAGEAAWTEGDIPADNIGRLRRMVMYQRSMILDLMCFKDTFESMQNKMASLKQVNEELQEQIRSLVAAGMDVPGTGTLESALEKNNLDIEKYIGILGKENTRLVGKFREWEEEFKRISGDVGEGDGGGAGVAEGRYTELVKEKEELAAKVNSLEDRIREQTRQIGEVQRQYEDLEKEYMVLYREQQKQQQEQQPPV